jgi:hypothetical protein
VEQAVLVPGAGEFTSSFRAIRGCLDPIAEAAGFALAEEVLDHELAWLGYRRHGPAGLEMLELTCRRDLGALIVEWWRPPPVQGGRVVCIRTCQWRADVDPAAVAGVIAAWLAEAGA